MSLTARDYRTMGRQHAQDKRRRAGQQAISDAEDALQAARTACTDAPYPSAEYTAAFAARRAAEDALEALDPKNWMFSS